MDTFRGVVRGYQANAFSGAVVLSVSPGEAVPDGRVRELGRMTRASSGLVFRRCVALDGALPLCRELAICLWDMPVTAVLNGAGWWLVGGEL